MRISRVLVRNFKSLRNVDVKLPCPLLALVGRNNSGKSAFLDAIALAGEATESGNVVPPPPLQPRGGWSELIFGKAETNDSIVIELDLDGTLQQLGLSFDPNSQDPEWRLERSTYRLELLPEQMRTAVDLQFEGRDPATFEFAGLGQVMSQGNVIFNTARFAEYMAQWRRLAADRRVDASLQAVGAPRLSPDGSNLIQVLNDLASAERQLFQRITEAVQRIVPEVHDLLAKLQPGTNSAVGSIREAAFGGAEFGWPHLASGTRQAILLCTLIHAAPTGSLVLIEEPELYLHTESVWHLLDMLSEQAEEGGKQIIMTTHSPLIVERLGLESCLVVSRDRATGETHIDSLESFKSLDSFLHKHGLMTHALLMPSKGLRPLPSFLLVVEGQEDVGVWQEFLTRARLPVEEIKVEYVRNGGWAEAGKAASLFKTLKRIGIADLPHLLVVESDDEVDRKTEVLASYGLDEDDYRIVPLDMEAYLIDVDAIASVVARDRGEIEAALERVKGRPSKQKLERIMRELGSPLNFDVRRRLAGALPQVPNEIAEITRHIQKALDDRP